MKAVVFLFLLFFSVSFAGNSARNFTFETTEPTDRIQLPNKIIDPNSVEITSNNPLPNWRFVGENNIVYFAEKIPENQRINIKYSVLHTGILNVYGLNLPRFIEGSDNNNFELITAGGSASADSSAISFEGVKTIGVSLGSNGEMMMEQSLFVEIFGYIDSNTKISAHINDQSSTLDGQTSEIGELDRIFLKVENPRWSAIAGDLEIRSRQNGILREFYTPKGIFAELKNDEIGRNNNAFAGISGTKSGYNRFVGISGIQNGRFNLRPNRNAGVVRIIPGSVRVLIDGRLQEENENFIVDYELASLRFTAGTPILDGQIIEVHYRYRDFEYNSFASGTQQRFSLLDSTLNFDFSFFHDNDIFNSGTREWTREELEIIRNSGKTPPKFLLGNRVHRNDVLRVQAFQRLYSLDGNIYRWESDPEAVYLTTNLYTVNFLFVGAGNGEYSIDAEQPSSVLGNVFVYVGEGNGTHTALGEVAMPSRSTKGEITINYNPSEQISLNITAAGENFSPNNLSVIDNSENSIGLKTDLFVSSNPDRNFLVRNDFSSAVAGNLFVDNVLSRHELNRRWGIENAEDYSLWENMLGMGFHRFFLLKGGYGRANADSSFNSQRISGGIESGRNIPFGFDYLYANITTEECNRSMDGRQQNANFSFDLSRFDLNLNIEEIWYQYRYQLFNHGEFTSRISAENKDKNLSGLVQYRMKTIGENEKHFSAYLHRQEFLISASADKETSENHSIRTDGSVIITEENVSFLLSLLNRNYSSDFSKGIDTRWNLSVENRSENRWEYIIVPDGTGTHIKDTITGNFVEFPFGNYIAREITVFDDFDRNRFTTNYFGIFWYNNLRNLRFSGDFGANSKTGIADLWYQYLPVMAIFHDDFEDKLLYSRIFYTQNFSFLPSHIPELSYDLRLGIGRNIDNINILHNLNGSQNFMYRWDRFHLGLGNRGFIERKKSSSISNNFNFLIRDINIRPLQNFVILDWLHLFLEETAGLISTSSITAVAKPVEVSGNYAEIRPGVRFLPTNAGTAEISYSFARVNFDGDLFFNMANGFAKNNNHRISAILGIRANEKLRFSGFARGDKNANTNNDWRFSASLNAEISIK